LSSDVLRNSGVVKSFLSETESKFKKDKKKYNKLEKPFLIEQFENLTGSIDVRICEGHDVFEKEVSKLISKESKEYKK